MLQAHPPQFPVAPRLTCGPPACRAAAYLRCQEFIEHLREGRREEALRTAQERIAPLLVAPSSLPSNGRANGRGNGAPSANREAGNGNGTGHGVAAGEEAANGGWGGVLDDEGTAMVHKVIGLVAYTDPSQSPLADVYDVSHRRVVADLLNAAMIKAEGGEETSCLEKLLKNLLVSHDTLRQLQGGRGEVLELPELIHRS